MSQHQIEIALNKSKLAKGLLSSIVFVIAGLWLLIEQPITDNPIINNPVVKYGAASAALLFFGFATIFYLLKLIDKRPGIVINEEGLFDNSGAVSVGLVPWPDIKRVFIARVMKQEFLIIEVTNPEDYLNRFKNFFKKKGMQYNVKNYGSPVAISTNGLKCDVNELVIIVNERLAEYQSKLIV
jgi:hypothetical protein